MKNNTKVRLHLSKTLFENIVKEVVSEAKKMNMSGGAYTEAVKMPKKAKKMEETNQPSSTSTTSVQDMNAAGYGDKPAIPGLREKKIKEVNAVADTKKMKKMEEVDAVTDTESMRKMHEMSSKEKMAKGLYKEDEMEEMQINVAEEGQMNEVVDVSWEAVAAGMAAIGLAPLAIDKLHQWWKKKHPESYKKAQALSGAIDRQAGGNTPGQGHGVDTSKTFGPQNESKKKVMPKLSELRKQIKNK
jgi:hypothetical protein